MDNRDFLNRIAEQAKAKSTFWDHIGASIEEFANGQVEVSLDIKPHHLNLIGIMHGGVYAALIDSAMGLLAMARKPDEDVVTTNLNMHYLMPAREGRLKVTARLVHCSRRMITAEGNAYNEQGELCAFGTGTFRVLERK